MPKIGPKLTAEELNESAEATQMGQRSAGGLPQVFTDAYTVETKTAVADYNSNCDLSEAIKAAMKEYKGGGRTPMFVLGWRMYPNADHPRWKNETTGHSCGCGCGCASTGKKRKKRRR